MIRIPKTIYDEIISYANSKLPNEACGILAGINNLVKKIYKMRNVEESPESYLMDPHEQIRVMKDIRENNMKMLAIFHSHPKTPARPSAKDINMAFYDDVFYIIVSFMNKIPDVKAFKIIGKSVTLEKILIED